MARLDSRVLLDFLEEVDKELERKVTLIAVKWGLSGVGGFARKAGRDEE